MSFGFQIGVLFVCFFFFKSQRKKDPVTPGTYSGTLPGNRGSTVVGARTFYVLPGGGGKSPWNLLKPDWEPQI